MESEPLLAFVALTTQRKILPELRLVVSAEGEESYGFRVKSPLGDYRVSFMLSSGWVAQLQRLHWKAENLLPEEDSFLDEIGTSLGKAMFAHSERSMWSPVLSSNDCDVVIEFEPGAFSAMVLPFELISVENQYLVDLSGVRIVRETGHVRDGSPLISHDLTELRILHVSFGADSALDLGDRKSVV